MESWPARKLEAGSWKLEESGHGKPVLTSQELSE
jgi:hypothetical protein